MSSDVDRRRAFESVVDVVYEPLQRYFGRRARPEDVLSLVDDALLVIWRRLDQVPPDEPLPWAYAVAGRCLSNHRRGEQRRLRLLGRLRAHHDGIAHHEPPMVESDHTELAAAVKGLADGEREVVRLWAWEQLEPHEIATVLGITPNAVSLRLSRARKKLAVSMERQDRDLAGHEGFGHRREPRS